MANLKRRFHFRLWAPDIGENRDLEEGPALFLELATGLTQAQLTAVTEAVTQPTAIPPLSEGLTGEALAAAVEARWQANLKALRDLLVGALGPYVRIHGGPHTVDGLPLGTLEDYLVLAQGAADFGAAAINELISALRSFNSFSGPDQLFSLRRSGGSASTGKPSVVKDSSPTEGP